MKPPPFAVIPADWAWILSKQPRELRLAIAIARFFNPDDPERCHPSFATLAKYSGVPEKHVGKAVKGLEAAGILRVTRRSGIGNVYFLFGFREVTRPQVGEGGTPQGGEPSHEQGPPQSGATNKDLTIEKISNSDPDQSLDRSGSSNASASTATAQPALLEAEPPKRAPRKRASYTVDEQALAKKMLASYAARFSGARSTQADFFRECAAARKLIKAGRTFAEIERAIERAENHPLLSIGDRFTSLYDLTGANWARVMAEPTKQLRMVDGAAPAAPRPRMADPARELTWDERRQRKAAGQ